MYLYVFQSNVLCNRYLRVFAVCNIHIAVICSNYDQFAFDHLYVKLGFLRAHNQRIEQLKAERNIRTLSLKLVI